MGIMAVLYVFIGKLDGQFKSVMTLLALWLLKNL